MKKSKILIVLLMVPALVLGLSFYKSHAQKDLYAYHFPINFRIEETNSKEFEVTKDFYEKRMRRDPTSYSDKAILAQIYLTEAKLTGSTEYFGKAEILAKISHQEMKYGNTAALKVLADVAQAQHQFRKAIDLASLMLKEKPQHPDAYIIMFNSYLALGEIDLANTYANKLVNLIPTENTFTLRGIVLSAQGKFEESLKDFNHAFTLEEDDILQAVWTRGIFARTLIENEKYDLANSVLKDSLVINPKASLNLFLMGEVLLKQSDPESAATYFKRAFSESKQLIYLYGEARAYKQMGKKYLANDMTTQIEKILRSDLKKNMATAHVNELIRILIERGSSRDIDEALTLAKKETLNRENVETLLFLAKAYEKNGKLEEAMEVINKMSAKKMKTKEMELISNQIAEELKKLGTNIQTTYNDSH
jgi:tetratricopeptide (TPR) repeat protein